MSQLEDRPWSPPVAGTATQGRDPLGAPGEVDAELARAVRATTALRTGFYVVVLLIALGGQVSGAMEALDMQWYVALPAVGALELGGMVVLANADVRRRLGEHATLSRLLSAAIAGGAVAFNWLAHANHLEGGFYGGMSLLGYLVWLMNTENKRRDRLRAKRQLPPTPPAYEVVGHWLRHPWLTGRARSLAKAAPQLGLYDSLDAARTQVRADRRQAALTKVLHRKIRQALDGTTADIAVAVYDLDEIARRLAERADYDGLTALIAADLAPARVLAGNLPAGRGGWRRRRGGKRPDPAALASAEQLLAGARALSADHLLAGARPVPDRSGDESEITEPVPAAARVEPTPRRAADPTTTRRAADATAPRRVAADGTAPQRTAPRLAADATAADDVAPAAAGAAPAEKSASAGARGRNQAKPERAAPDEAAPGAAAPEHADEADELEDGWPPEIGGDAAGSSRRPGWAAVTAEIGALLPAQRRGGRSATDRTAPARTTAPAQSRSTVSASVSARRQIPAQARPPVSTTVYPADPAPRGPEADPAAGRGPEPAPGPVVPARAAAGPAGGSALAEVPLRDRPLPDLVRAAATRTTISSSPVPVPVPALKERAPEADGRTPAQGASLRTRVYDVLDQAVPVGDDRDPTALAGLVIDQLGLPDSDHATARRHVAAWRRNATAGRRA